MRQSNVTLLCNENNGINIPFIMAQRLKDAGWTNITSEDVEIINQGVEHDQYWDVWEEILSNAEYHDNSTSQVFKLHQDGDLWAYCPASLTPSEHNNLFGEFPDWYNQDEE